MKREFLEGLDLGEGRKLTKEAVDAIMAENGKDIEAKNSAIATLTGERDRLQTQLTDAQGQLTAAQEWETKYNTDTQALQSQLSALQTDINTRNARDKVSAETGVPAGLLTGETEEACKAQAQGLLDFAKNYGNGVPSLPDGGEVVRTEPQGTDAAWRSFAAQINQDT